MTAREHLVAALLAEDGPVRKVWDREPVVVRSSGLAALLPGSDSLLDTPMLRPPYVMVLMDGVQVTPNKYCRSARITNVSSPEPMVDRPRLDRVLATGAAIKLNRMELWSPPVAALASLIGAACCRKVKVWGFLSPHGQNLVPVHRDPSHVFAVQVEGTKAWTLGGPRPAGAWSAMGDPVVVQDETHVDLTTGDVLYLPYGHAHRAAATTASSFHIAFSLEGTTVGELRHRILQVLVDRVDGTDSTEVRSDNIRDVLGGLVDVLERTTDQIAQLPERDLSEVYSGRTAEVIGTLLDGESRPRIASLG